MSKAQSLESGKPLVAQPTGLESQSATCLWLIRHAEVELTYHGRFGGRADMELSPRGHDQATALARHLRERAFHAIYASPLKRVQQTLAPLLTNGGPKPVICPDLREVDLGDWTGLTWDEVYVRFGVRAFEWLDQLERAAIPNAECAETLRVRLEPCLRQIIADHPGQQVAVFCHGGVIRMLLGILLGLPLSKTAVFEIDYASVTQVALHPHYAQVQLLNFVPWREVAG